jgi:hypothetical protein
MATALSVFMCSGLLHEYLAYVNIGWIDYKLYMGQEMCFFTVHGIAVMLEKVIVNACKGQPRIRSPIIMIVRRVWTLGFACLAFPLFLQAIMHWDS